MNRYGDFVWSRGETRDLSKAEFRAPPHVDPPYEGSVNVSHYSFIDSRGGEYKYKKAGNGLFVYSAKEIVFLCTTSALLVLIPRPLLPRLERRGPELSLIADISLSGSPERDVAAATE